MDLRFNSAGNLYRTISLTYEKFLTHFATNRRRKQQITNALSFFRIFHSCGGQTVYIDGSFVSTKEFPEDIDLCFDITTVDKIKLSIEFSDFFNVNAMGNIHRELQCHIFHFDSSDQTLLDLLSNDREGNPKGLVKLDLTDIIHYHDQK